MTDLEYERRERECIRQFDGKMTQAEAERQTAVEMGETTDVHPGPKQVSMF